MQRAHWKALQLSMARQEGMVTIAQALALGLDRHDLRWAVCCGDPVRIRRGVVGLPGVILTPARAQRAGLLAAGDGAVLSHFGAAGRHGFPGVQPGAVELSVPRRRAARMEGVKAHSAPDLGTIDTTLVGGVPCTTMARTAVDLTALVHHDGLRRIVAHVERARRPRGIAEIRAAAGRVSPKRRPDVAPLLHLIGRMLGGEVGLDLTPRYLAAFEAAGIRQPALEVPVTWGGRVFVLDGAFLLEQVNVEFDDDWSHATAMARTRTRSEIGSPDAQGGRWNG